MSFAEENVGSGTRRANQSLVACISSSTCASEARDRVSLRTNIRIIASDLQIHLPIMLARRWQIHRLRSCSAVMQTQARSPHSNLRRSAAGAQVCQPPAATKQLPALFNSLRSNAEAVILLNPAASPSSSLAMHGTFIDDASQIVHTMIVSTLS